MAAVCAMILLAATVQYTPLPEGYLKSPPVSPVVTDIRGNILARRISVNDSRFHPVPLSKISPWLIRAMRFRTHPAALSASRAAN